MPPETPLRSPSVSSYTSSRHSLDNTPTTTGLPRADTIHLTPLHAAPSANDRRELNNPYSGGMGNTDLRSSSTQSLRPIESAGDRRRLLVVYIHGFMGTETSFQSFPAHVHNLLTASLVDTHIVHTKIYPRYQSRKDIRLTRDAFSSWLEPHESENTDVVLVGHSLGGILAAEVVLMPSHRSGSDDLFQHRILGHIAYDTPFLGMHYGVVGTGIASLFKPKPVLPEMPPSTADGSSSQLSFSSFESTPSDPNYNPAFPNDVKLAERGTTLSRAMYFLNKHQGEWTKAASSYVKSHLEFGGCLADYTGLKNRYASFRPLENVDVRAGKKTAAGTTIPRVRFVNYYTASTGVMKKKKKPSTESQSATVSTLEENTNLSDVVGSPSSLSLAPDSELSKSRSTSFHSVPKISLGEETSDTVLDEQTIDLDSDEASLDDKKTGMHHISPRAVSPSDETLSSSTPEALNARTETVPVAAELTTQTSGQSSTSSITTASIVSFLPPLPPPPIAPIAFDAELYKLADANTIKIAKKEHERLDKIYQKQKKDHDKLVSDREKVVAKQQKAQEKSKQVDTRNSDDKKIEDSIIAQESASIKQTDKEEKARQKAAQKQEAEAAKAIAKAQADKEKAEKKAQAERAKAEQDAVKKARTEQEKADKERAKELKDQEKAQAAAAKEEEKQRMLEQERIEVQEEFARQRLLAYSILDSQMKQAEDRRDELLRKKDTVTQRTLVDEKPTSSSSNAKVAEAIRSTLAAITPPPPPSYQEATHISSATPDTETAYDLETYQRVLAHQLRAEAALNTTSNRNPVPNTATSDQQTDNDDAVRQLALAHQMRAEAQLGLASTTPQHRPQASILQAHSRPQPSSRSLTPSTIPTRPPDPLFTAAPQKSDRRFCSLPTPADKTWIRVPMDNMDCVVAHTSLFFVGEVYAKLVGDTARRIEEWAREYLVERKG